MRKDSTQRSRITDHRSKITNQKIRTRLQITQTTTPHLICWSKSCSAELGVTSSSGNADGFSSGGCCGLGLIGECEGAFEWRCGCV